MRALRLLLVRPGDAPLARRSLPPGSRVAVLPRLAYRVFGPAVDLTDPTLEEPVVRTLQGTRVLAPSPPALAAQLLLAAAAGFAADGFPGALAIDLRLLAIATGPLSLDPGVTSRGGPASLIHAVDAVERFCPGTFATPFVSFVASQVSARRRELGRSVQPLRLCRLAGTGPPAAALVPGRLGRIRLLLRPPGLVG